MPCCPAGHITCSPCLAKLKRQGKGEGPICRKPMGEGKSALAKVVIEHMEHQCSLEGCQDMVAFEGYKEHQASCQYRLAICPSKNPACKKMVPFCKLEEHAKACPGIIVKENLKQGKIVWLPENMVKGNKQGSDLTWTSEIFSGSRGRVFFFMMSRIHNLYTLEVVMLGNEEDCKKYIMEVSVKSPDSYTDDIQARFRPRPIGPTNDTDGFCLTFKQKTLAKFWRYNMAKKGYEFMVSVRAV